MNIGRRPVAVSLLLAFPLAVGASAPAEPSPRPGRVPDSLLLEMVIAPGYRWMETCLQSTGSTGAGGEANAGAADGHAAHHPGPGASGSPLGEAGLDRTRAALESMMDRLDRLRSTPGEDPRPARVNSSP